MTPEKDLLKRVLCEMLPYETICEDIYGNSGILFDVIPELNSVTLKISESGSTWTTDIDKIKPYLRPMSSMTEEEEFELNGLLQEVYDFSFRMDELLETIQMQKTIPFQYIDWLNAHHFDYCGLIEKGLALQAPKE